jgi:demethylmenaquinone methyltransferase/2-methoxy-6-polyprenyl-1,4-benzoquinol methylase
MNTESSLVSYYADRAKEYERIYHKPERQDDLRKLRSFVGGAFDGMQVFEVACGTGYWTEIVARSAASVVVTDINEEVLAIARSKPVDTSKTTFRREDAYNLPLFSQRFAGGLAVFWWSHIPKARLRNFLRGFHQVLSPGASVVFIDNCYVEGSSTPVSRTDEHGDTYQIRRLDDGSTHEVLKNFPTESELHAAVEGLADDVRVEFLQYYWILSYVPKMFPAPPDNLSFGEVRLRFVRLVPSDPTRNFVPFYHFRILVSDGSDVGYVNFRIGDTEHVRVCAGDIGFEILEPFRGRGYALQACRAIAPFVRSFYDAVTITCDPDNHASLRIIERLGASFTDEVPVPPHDPQYQRGSRSKRRYRWTL